MLVREVLEIGSAVYGPPTPDEAIRLGFLFSPRRRSRMPRMVGWRGGMAAVHVLCRVRGPPAMYLIVRPVLTYLFHEIAIGVRWKAPPGARRLGWGDPGVDAEKLKARG